MVKLKEVKAANASLRAAKSGLVAVVAGGTSGIGRGFIDALASSVDKSKIYIIGRNEQTLHKIVAELESLNSTNTYVPIATGDLTLLANVDRATDQIIAQEKSKVDILYMSPGYISFASRDESTEGLDKITSIRYYARTRILVNLLPLLNAAPSPRVVSILAGGMEGEVWVDDLSLKNSKKYGLVSAGNMAATYITLSMEHLQKENPKISFVHMFPGPVNTPLLTSEHISPLLRFIFSWIVIPLVARFMLATVEDAGQQSLYAATSESFGPATTGSSEKSPRVKGSNGVVGSGVYTLNEKQEPVVNDKVLKPYREQGVEQIVWDHTVAEFKRIRGN